MKDPKDFRLLIVDDEPVIRETLVINFEMNGYTIFEASGAYEALEIVKNNKIHFIISDMRMPEGNGEYLLDRLREIDPEIPVIVIVSGFSELSKEDAIKKGAIDLLDKPINFDLLESYIEKFRSEL